MTLKYNQGHWKWYEWVKRNEYYHHAKFDIYYIIYSVRENRNVKISTHTDTRPAGRPNTDHYIDSHFSCEWKNENQNKHKK